MSGGAAKQNFRKQQVTPAAQFSPTVGASQLPTQPVMPVAMKPKPQRALITSKPGSLLDALSPKRPSAAFTKGPMRLKGGY